MSFSASPRIPGQPTNTGSQQVSTRYSRTDGTATAAGTPKAARPPISAASTAPTPPGVGAAEASVPPTIVTTVQVTNVAPPPKASTLAHSASAAPRVVPAQPSTISANRFGSRASSTVTSFSRGRTAVPSQWRSLGTSRNAPRMPSATPAIRYSTVAPGTKCLRSIDAPATVLNKISNMRWVITCTDCCSATAAVSRIADRPAFCKNRVLSASPPTPAGVVVAAKVLATCAIDSFQKLTVPSVQAHNAAAAPTY